MKLTSFFMKLFACIALLVLSGCGGEGKSVNGSLTVVAGGVTTSGNISQVPFTVTYTNPQKSDVLGVEITITSQLDNGAVRSFTYSTSNSGVNIYTFTVTQTTSSQILRVSAKTGDLTASASAIIPGVSAAPSTLSTSMSSVTFASGAATGTSQTLTISTTGTLPFTIILSPSPNNDISVTTPDPNANPMILTVRKIGAASATGTANIIVSDSSLSPGVVVIPVTY